MKMLTILSTFVLPFVLSINAYSQYQHTTHLDNLVNHYLSAKEALANDNFDAAQQYIAELKTEAASNAEMNHHPEHLEMHAKHHENMIKALTRALKTQNLEELRSAFKPISDNLITALKNQGYDQEIFIYYCPMALDGDGAFWISSDKTVENPYMGQQMPNCGVEKELLNS